MKNKPMLYQYIDVDLLVLYVHKITKEAQLGIGFYTKEIQNKTKL
jgi:hypothetical protein